MKKSTLYLIRHAQASAEKDDYDQLSSLGKQQCISLSDHLKNKPISAVYVGPRKRHWQTYALSAQDHWPAPQKTSLLDEFPAHALLQFGLQQLTFLEPQLAPSITALKNRTIPSQQAYGLLLQKLTHHWIAGNLQLAEIENTHLYHERIQRQLHLLIENQGNQLIFSSAGTISSMVGLACHAKPSIAIQSAWKLFNTSITRIDVQDGTPILSCFNKIEHIPIPERTRL